MKIDQSFPIKYRSKHFQWMVTDSTWIDPIKLLEPLLENSDMIPEEDFYKNERRRLIFRYSGIGEQNNPDLLVKGFPLTKMKDRLRYRKYAIAEATNLIQAKKRGLPVPTPHAIGLCRGFRADFNAVVMDYLPYLSMRDLFLSPLAQDARKQLLTRVSPLIKTLYFEGVNHIDFGPHAILLAKEKRGVDFIIDWQYANFTKRQDPKLLATLSGGFGWTVATNRDWLSAEAVTSWFLELLDQLRIMESQNILDIFQKNLTKRVSAKDRLNRSVQGF